MRINADVAEMTEMENHEEITVPSVMFLGEQDGVPERELKGALRSVFASSPVTEAFLAVLRYQNETETRVALCLAASKDYEGIVKVVSQVFWEMYRSDVSLDLMFLDEKQREEIKEVCRCFYKVEKA